MLRLFHAVTAVLACLIVAPGWCVAQPIPCALQATGVPSLGGLQASAIYAIAKGDDGGGPAVFLAGSFYNSRFNGYTGILRVRNGEVDRIAVLYNAFYVKDMTIYDDGDGPRLYVGGRFGLVPGSSVGVLVGSDWRPVVPSAYTSSVSEATSLVVHDDGSGPALYIGGTHYSGVWPNQYRVPVLRYRAGSLSEVRPDLLSNNYDVRLLSADIGAGPRLFSNLRSSDFTACGAVLAWDGATWASASGMYDGAARGLGVQNIPGGQRLFITGWFSACGGPLGTGGLIIDAQGARPIPGSEDEVWLQTVELSPLEFHDDTGSAMYFVGGDLRSDPAPRDTKPVLRWDGEHWSRLPGVIGQTGSYSTINAAENVTDFLGASSPALLVGGDFTVVAGAPARALAAWTSRGWSDVFSIAPSTAPISAATWTSQGRPALFLAGDFAAFSTATSVSVAAFDGLLWRDASAGLPWRARALFSDPRPVGGIGGGLFAAHELGPAYSDRILRLSRYDGAAWQPLPGVFSGVGPTIAVMTVAELDGSPTLIVGGGLSQVDGVPTSSIARWTGSGWSQMGEGFDRTVRALAVFDADGPGPAPARLIAGGDFNRSGSTTLRRIAAWNGSSWESLGFDLYGGVRALSVHDDGAGQALFIAGTFGGSPNIVGNIARWNGSSLTPLGTGCNGIVNALSVFDADGAGPLPPTLAVGGTFTSAGGVAAQGLAFWDGTGWSAPPPTAGSIGLLAAAQLDRPTLLLAGSLSSPLGSPLAMALVFGCGSGCPADLNTDGRIDMADLGLMLDQYGRRGSPGGAAAGGLPSDLTGDGVTDFIDLNALLAAYGAGC